MAASVLATGCSLIVSSGPSVHSAPFRNQEKLAGLTETSRLTLHVRLASEPSRSVSDGEMTRTVAGGQAAGTRWRQASLGLASLQAHPDPGSVSNFK